MDLRYVLVHSWMNKFAYQCNLFISRFISFRIGKMCNLSQFSIAHNRPLPNNYIYIYMVNWANTMYITVSFLGLSWLCRPACCPSAAAHWPSSFLAPLLSFIWCLQLGPLVLLLCWCLFDFLCLALWKYVYGFGI